MGESTEDRMRRTIRRVVEMLVEGDYTGLESLTKGLRLESEHIAAGVADYGRRLAYPPANAYDAIDAVEVAGKQPPQYSVRFRLFTHLLQCDFIRFASYDSYKIGGAPWHYTLPSGAEGPGS